MKTYSLNFLLIVLFFVSLLITGCATTTSADWNSRVGHYTYAQAVSELGPPNRQVSLSNGGTEFRWFLRSHPNDNFGVGVNNNNINNNGMNNFGPNQNMGPSFNNRYYLQLTFDANGVLTAWSKNY